MGLVLNEYHDFIKLNVALLLDDISRKKIKTSLADFKMNGIYIINSLGEINEKLLEKTNKVVILEDYVKIKNYYSVLKILKSLLNLEYIYIGSNQTYLDHMSSIATCFKMDISMLDYNQVYSVVMQDEAVASRYRILDDDTTDDILRFAREVKTDKNVDNKVKDLAESYEAMIDIIREQGKVIKNLRNENGRQERILNNEKELVTKLSNSHFKLLNKVREHNSKLLDYEVIYSKDIYEKVILSNFRDRPLVIYFKEYQEMCYLNSFLKTITDMIRFNLKLTCKIVKLYDSSDSKKLHLQPKEAKIIRNNYTLKDISSSDYIIKFGSYVNLLSDVLNNKINCDVLLLVDCKNHADIITLGNDLHYNICRNKKYFSEFDLEARNTITNDSNSLLSWRYYSAYGQIKNEEDRFMYLSNRGCMKIIFEDIKRCIGGI